MTIGTRLKPGQSGRAIDTAIAAASTIAVIASAALAGAWFFQLVLKIYPCQLCLEQRYAYYVAIPLAIVIAIAAKRGLSASLLLGGLALLAAITLANAGLGTYHAGVEWGWWPGPSSCSGSIADLSPSGNLLDQLNSVKIVSCDQVQWRFLGLSLAGYNVMISLTMAMLAFWGTGELSRRTSLSRGP